MCNVEGLFPNSNTSDGSTVERRSWENGDNCVTVQELKVINGGHDWPGSSGNMDINASQEIWKFVSKYDINGLINCISTAITTFNDVEFEIFPNPSSNVIYVNKLDKNNCFFHPINGFSNELAKNKYMYKIRGLK